MSNFDKQRSMSLSELDIISEEENLNINSKATSASASPTNSDSASNTKLTKELEKCKRELTMAQEQIRVLKQNSKVEFLAMSEERGLAKKKIGEREKLLREREDKLKQEREGWETEAARLCAEVEATRDKLETLKEDLDNKEIKLRNLEENEKLVIKLKKELEIGENRMMSLSSLRDKQHGEIMALRNEISAMDIKYHLIKDEKEKMSQDLKSEIRILKEELEKKEKYIDYNEINREEWPMEIKQLVEKNEKEMEKKIEDKYIIRIEGLEELLMSEQGHLELLESETRNSRMATESIRRQMETRITELTGELMARDTKLNQIIKNEELSNIREEKLKNEIITLESIIREKNGIILNLKEEYKVNNELRLTHSEVIIDKKDIEIETDPKITYPELEELKEKLEMIENKGWREGMDINYIRNVLIASFQNGTLPQSNPIGPVLLRLLMFTPEEMARANKPEEVNIKDKKEDENEKSFIKKYFW